MLYLTFLTFHVVVAQSNEGREFYSLLKDFQKAVASKDYEKIELMTNFPFFSADGHPSQQSWFEEKILKQDVWA